jgi:hypothetical protein
MPRDAGIAAVAIAGLPEIGLPGVELSPANRDFVAVGRINGH